MSDLPGSRTEASISAWGNTDAASLHEVLEEDLQQSGALAALRKDWELGRWERLAAVDPDAFNDPRTIQSAALIVAVANQQLGDHKQVRDLINRALSAGASRALAVSVLVSGVHNLLGRARSVGGDRGAAETQFRHSVAIGTDPGRRPLVAAARAGEQALQLGLKRFGNGDLAFPNVAPDQQIKPRAENYARLVDPTSRYLDAPRILVEREAPPFVLLDSKSLPRSGLHYLKTALEKRLGDRFSFCEWYQEPGCCRGQPCKLTGFLEEQYRSHGPSVRLVKSHDFELNDRIVPTSFSLRRLVLKRDPLFILTSWFVLNQLLSHRECLRNAGIHMEKIWWQHEPAVLAMAYSILDENFHPPSQHELDAWLNQKTRYIQEFHKKWIYWQDSSTVPYVYVVDYVNLRYFLDRLLEELGCAEGNERPEADSQHFSNGKRQAFRPRGDPFSTPSRAITHFIQGEAERFRRYAVEAGSFYATDARARWD